MLSFNIYIPGMWVLGQKHGDHPCEITRRETQRYFKKALKVPGLTRQLLLPRPFFALPPPVYPNMLVVSEACIV